MVSGCLWGLWWFMDVYGRFFWEAPPCRWNWSPTHSKRLTQHCSINGHIVGRFNPLVNPLICVYHSWLVVSTPLKNMKVSWDDYAQYMKKMFQTTNQILYMFMYIINSHILHYITIDLEMIKVLKKYRLKSESKIYLEMLDLLPMAISMGKWWSTMACFWLFLGPFIRKKGFDWQYHQPFVGYRCFVSSENWHVGVFIIFGQNQTKRYY